MGHLLVRIDYEMVVHPVEEGLHIGMAEATGLHAHDRLGHAGSTGQQGTQDVGLVIGRHGHEQVRILDAGSAERQWVGAAPEDRHYVELFLDLPEPHRVGLDEGHMVALTAETFGYVGADLAGSHHDYVHRPILPHGRP